MKKGIVLLLLLNGLALALCLRVPRAQPLAPVPFPSTASAPNVLLVTLDCLRPDHVGVYGHPACVTPSLDRLAARGTRYLHAYAQSDTTTASTLSLLFSRWCSQLYCETRDTGGYPVPTSLSRRFKTRGHATAAFVSSLELVDPRIRDGLDTYEGPTETTEQGRWSARHTTDRALDWLRHRAPGEPWFMWLMYWDMHGADQHYDEAVTQSDRCLGEVLDAIAARGELDKTIIVATAQHGYDPVHGLSGHGLYEPSLAVPLIISAPGFGPAGKVEEAPVMLVDVYPTVLSLAGLEAVPCVGLDLRKSPPLRRPTYAETWNLEGRSVRDGRWRFIEYIKNISLGPHEGVTSGTPDPKRPGFFICRAKGARELYDLESDPTESRNLAEQMPDVARALHDHLAQWQQQRGRSEVRVPMSDTLRRALQQHGYDF